MAGWPCARRYHRASTATPSSGACVPASTTSACQGPAAIDGPGAERASSIRTTAVRRRLRDAGSITLFPRIRRPAAAAGPYREVPVEGTTLARLRPLRHLQSQEARLPSSALVRFALTRACAPRSCRPGARAAGLLHEHVDQAAATG